MSDKRLQMSSWIIGISFLMVVLTLTAGCHPYQKLRNMRNAARKGNLSQVKALLESEPDIEERNTLASKVLYSASATDHTEIVKFLLENGANVNGLDGWTPLHGAAGHGRVKVVKILLANGADVNRCGRGKLGVTPLYLATARGKLGATPLYLAKARDKKEVMRVLLENGADPDIKCESGVTPLLRAVLDEQSEIADILLFYGADINHENVNRGTALHVAVALDRPEMAKYLLSKGADVDAEIGLGYTPLHSSAYCNRLVIARLLLEHGADTTLQCDGRTALQLARSDEFRKLLKQYDVAQRR